MEKKTAVACVLMQEKLKSAVWNFTFCLVILARTFYKNFLFAWTSPLNTSAMETLDGTDWDVLIVGTGIKQSLLAL